MSLSFGRRWLLFILVSSFLLRAAAGIALQIYLDGLPGRHFLIEGDANGYWELSRKLAAGEDYSLYEPPRSVMRMPGFPALLTLSGGHFLVARLLLAAVGTLACVLVFVLGRDLLGERIGLIAAGLTAVSPPMVLFSVAILTETTFALFQLAALILMARLLKSAVEEGDVSRKSLLAFAVGVTVAAGCFCRPSWLLAGPLFVIILVASARKRRVAVVYSLLILGGLIVVFTPWVIRNARVTGGKFVLLSLWAGPSLYDGLNPHAGGDSDMSFVEQDQKYQELSEYETNRYYQRKSWEFVREHPGRTICLAGRKLIRFWKPWPNAVQFRRWWLMTISGVWFAVIYVPAILAVRGIRDKRRTLLFTLGPVLYFSAIHVVFVGSIRYRLPAEYAVHILTAAGLVLCWERRRSKTGSADTQGDG